MPHHRPRVGPDGKRNRLFTAAILLVILGISGWALHGGASVLNAARLFGS
jgi:hypothetical protein